MRISAWAKINWTLDITGVRGDGYHDIDTLMQRISLCDDIDIAPCGDLRLTITGRIGGVPDDDSNLVLKAATCLQSARGVMAGAHVTLTKRIPSMAGLGGGSADAAATLLGLNAFWNAGASQDELLRMAVQLGADVPFCMGFAGSPARARGIGEDLEAQKPAAPCWLVIVKPEGGLSTRAVFAAYDARPVPPMPVGASAAEWLARGDWQSLSVRTHNALMSAACRLLPDIPRAMRALADAGAVMARMSGSGSAVYGVFREEATAQSAAEALAPHWPFVCIANNHTFLL